MAVNKVVTTAYSGDMHSEIAQIDLTEDTVTQNDVVRDVWFHLPNGERVQGMLVDADTPQYFGGSLGCFICGDPSDEMPMAVPFMVNASNSMHERPYTDNIKVAKPYKLSIDPCALSKGLDIYFTVTEI